MKARLAAVMIARNESRCIARALQSVRDIVDEMVVVDTGSTDGTPDIAATLGARVHHVAWADDFSSARNAALERTDAEYRLCIDADEWLIDGGAALRDWVDGSSCPRFGALSVVSTFDDDQQSVTDTLVRVLPSGAAYEGRIHEQATGGFDVTACPVVLRHDGYHPAQWSAKQGRNATLLRLELEEDSSNGYLWYQLGCALDADGLWGDAVPAFTRAMATTSQDAQYRHPLVARYLYALGRGGLFTRAISEFERESATWRSSPDVHFVMADVLLDLALEHPEQAATVLPVMRRLLEHCLDIGERPDLPGAVAGRGSWSARQNLEVCLATMAALPTTCG